MGRKEEPGKKWCAAIAWEAEHARQCWEAQQAEAEAEAMEVEAMAMVQAEAEAAGSPAQAEFEAMPLSQV